MIVSLCTSYGKVACPPIRNGVPLQHDSTKGSCCKMTNKELTFNDLPQVVAELRDEVSCMKALLLNLQNKPIQQRENRHRPVTPEQVAEYTNIPLATIYQKLANREIPGTKPGKRWVIYLDEIDKWLEANRKNPIPLTDEEQNAAILASHKRKPKKADWQESTECKTLKEQ